MRPGPTIRIEGANLLFRKGLGARRSIAFPFLRQQFRAAHFQPLIAVDFLEPGQKVRPPRGNARLGELSLAVTRLRLAISISSPSRSRPSTSRKRYRQIAHGRFSHVMHYSITYLESPEPGARLCGEQDIGRAKWGCPLG